LIAPAGNLAKLNTALAYGADTVYAGIPDFSLRARINRFDSDTLAKAVDLCHKQDRRLYVTLNIYAHNRHLHRLKPHIKQLRDLGVDGLVVSDPGVLETVKTIWPEASLHLSTQANCTNSYAARFWARLGVKRIILARELELSEIRRISEECPDLELEYFVHGAMCLAYAGRCFLSRHFTDRSANQGDCAQPCRWQYLVQEDNRPDKPLLVDEGEDGSYIFNAQDLCLLKHLDKLYQAGVRHFKLEGRAKSVYYVATVSGAYRQAVKLFSRSMEKEERQRELDRLAGELGGKLAHRGYTTGFLFGKPAEPNRAFHHTEPGWEFCGQVEEAARTGEQATIKVHNSLKAGDQVEAVVPPYTPVTVRVEGMVDAATGEALQEAHGGQEKRIKLRTPEALPKYCVLRRKIIN